MSWVVNRNRFWIVFLVPGDKYDEYEILVINLWGFYLQIDV